jgi:hypothetical protein
VPPEHKVYSCIYFSRHIFIKIYAIIFVIYIFVGIYKLSKLEHQRRLQNVVAGLTDTLNALAAVQKSKIEFIEAADGMKLAYRSYQPSSSVNAIFVIVASNSHFHDIITDRLAKDHPIAAYILEMRGFGYSGGPRGSSPSKEQVTTDLIFIAIPSKVSYIVRFIK